MQIWPYLLLIKEKMKKLKIALITLFMFVFSNNAFSITNQEVEQKTCMYMMHSELLM